MRIRIAVAVLVLGLCGCPAGTEEADTALGDDALALKLEQAASLSLDSWEVLKTSPTLPQLTQLDGQETLTPLLLFLHEEPREAEGWKLLTPHVPSPTETSPAVERSKASGYVSVLQAEDVTQLSCDWKTDSAEGVVEWTASGHWKGKASFTLVRVDSDWQVRRFAVEGVGVTERFDDHWFVVKPNMLRPPGSRMPPDHEGSTPPAQEVEPTKDSTDEPAATKGE